MTLITDAKALAQQFAHLKRNEVLTTLHNCEIGIATEGVKGYTPTGIKAHTHNYNEAKEVVQNANFIIDPTLSGLDIARIQCSTL